jgi:Tfp pilus assembly protein PilN
VNRHQIAQLHIEWTPHWVRAISLATGESAEAQTIADLGSFLNGHRGTIVGIGRSSVFLKTLRLPKASPDDLRRILDVQISQHFPLPASELSFDFVQTADQTVDGYLTMVAAIRSSDLRQVRDELRAAGLSVERILPIALGSIAIAARYRLPTALIAEATPNGVGLDVVAGGTLVYSRIAPAAGAPLEEAQRTMSAARTPDAPIITVGDVELPGEPSMQSPLALLAEAGPFDFELTEDRIRESNRRVAARMRVAVAMLLAAILGVQLVGVFRERDAKAVNRVQTAFAGWSTKQKSIRSTEVTKAARLVEIQHSMQRAFGPAQPLSDITSVVADSLPSGAWLTGLTIERGKPLQVRGTAKTGEDIAKFVDSLGANPRFRDVRLVFANSALIGKVPVVEFNVSATCVGNLPMPTPSRTAAHGARANPAASSASTGAPS